MRNLIVLIIVALVTITILLFLFNPEILTDIWLWIVGLIGPIIALFRGAIEGLSNAFKKDQRQDSKKSPPDPAIERAHKERIKQLEDQVARLEKSLAENRDAFDGTTISVVRYFDDGETTLGLLFFDSDFYCYTLEDAFREVKVKGKTRIPKGTYNLDFYKTVTPLTEKYRKTRDWFDFHLHIQDVPNFTNVYIHSGSDHTHTEGCLLIADSILSSNQERTIFNSRKTYERFYKKIKKLRQNNVNVRVKLFDEDWFESNDLKNRKV
jgi:hypothetical protein